MTTTTFFARLQLAIDGKTSPPPINAEGVFSPAFLARYSYKLHIKRKDGVTVAAGGKTFSGKFNGDNLRSQEHAFKTSGAALDTLVDAGSNFKVVWEIFFDGQLHHSVDGQLFEESRLQSNEWSRFNIKFSHANTKWSTGEPNVATVTISAGVGWYLIKKQETFGDFVQRAFSKATQINWDAMKDVNAHLGSVKTTTLLKPGQVVIVSKTKTHSNPKLQAMKAAAVQAQAAWVNANVDGKIDSAEMVLLDLLMQGHELVAIPAGAIVGPLPDYLAQAVAVTDDQKKYIDATMGLVGVKKAMLGEAGKARQALAKSAQTVAYTTEKGTTKRATRAAAQANPKQFALLNDSSLARKLVQWDTGIQAGRARDYIRHDIQLRSATINGGVAQVAVNLSKLKQVGTYVKGAGYVGIALEALASGAKAHDAYGRGDVKGGNVELGKGVGSIVGGSGAGAIAGSAVMPLLLLIGIGTGGVGLVVIGVVAAGVGYAGAQLGSDLGEGIANKVNSEVFK
jgi:hypothetical protein